MSKYLKITWKNSTDLNPVYYAGGFENRIYLDVEVDKPEYPFTEENEIDGANREIPIFKKWQKQYKFEVWGTEDLVDAFTYMQMCDTIVVTLQTGVSIAVDQLKVTSEWLDCVCHMTVKFTEDYIISTKCNDVMLEDCLCTTEAGSFLEVVRDSDLGGLVAANHDYALVWSVQTFPDELYVATLQQYHTGTGWAVVDVAQNECWENLDDNSHWIYDGTYWMKMGGCIVGCNLVAGNTYVLSAYIPEYCWAEVKWLAMIGWISAGIFTQQELAAGIQLDIVESGGIALKLFGIGNHSCDYGDSDVFSIFI